MTNITQPGAHLRAEIAEQPDRWLELLECRREIDAAAERIRSVQPKMLVIAARGSSDHAGLYAQYLVHNVLGIPVQLATPSTTTIHGKAISYPPAAMIAISQSGASPDLIDTVRAARNAGLPVLAFTNAPESSLALSADTHVPLVAGEEQSVAATKTYMAELLALYLLISRIGGQDWPSIMERTSAAIADAQRALQTLPEAVTDAVEVLLGADRALVIGRGYSMATAKEGALKLTETSAIAASGWSAADATHGPLGQVVPGTPVVALTAAVEARESVTKFARAASQLGGRIITFDTESFTTADKSLIPLVEILPLQYTALQLALRNQGCGWGLNPPVSRSDLAVVCRPRGYVDRWRGGRGRAGSAAELVNITVRASPVLEERDESV